MLCAGNCVSSVHNFAQLYYVILLLHFFYVQCTFRSERNPGPQSALFSLVRKQQNYYSFLHQVLSVLRKVHDILVLILLLAQQPRQDEVEILKIFANFTKELIYKKKLVHAQIQQVLKKALIAIVQYPYYIQTLFSRFLL